MGRGKETHVAGGFVWTIGINDKTHRKTSRTLPAFDFVYENLMENGNGPV